MRLDPPTKKFFHEPVLSVTLTLTLMTKPSFVLTIDARLVPSRAFSSSVEEVTWTDWLGCEAGCGASWIGFDDDAGVNVAFACWDFGGDVDEEGVPVERLIFSCASAIFCSRMVWRLSMPSGTPMS